MLSNIFNYVTIQSLIVLNVEDYYRVYCTAMLCLPCINIIMSTLTTNTVDADSFAGLKFC